MPTAPTLLHEGAVDAQAYTITVDTMDSTPHTLELSREGENWVLSPSVRFEWLTGESFKEPGSRNQIEYQLGYLNDHPLLVTLDAPVNKDLGMWLSVGDIQQQFNPLLEDLSKQNFGRMIACQNGTECVQTCNRDKPSCCKVRCKKSP
jgi:hypothetical protein